jgi:hypothetical protein
MALRLVRTFQDGLLGADNARLKDAADTMRLLAHHGPAEHSLYP